MLQFQAHALYDFDGQSGTGELTIRCGEVLTIIRKDVGEGWWEGTNSSGQSGLFPEAYVEVKRTTFIKFKYRASIYCMHYN